MELIQSLNDLGAFLASVGYESDAQMLDEISETCHDNPKKGVSKVLKMFSSSNDFFYRSFDHFEYPESKEIQNRFLSLKECLSMAICRNITR